MKNLWNEQEAAQYRGSLQQRVYTSRLLGSEPALVMHGGGNTSVKIIENDIFGESQPVLYVKGSGWDLATIEAAGFAPVRLDHLRRLAKLPKLSDPQMVAELKMNTLSTGAPAPSVEAILHAVLPFDFVDHTHADAIVTITNTEGGEEKIRRIFGDDVVIIPYVMPGFDLAKSCARHYEQQAHTGTVGMVLMNHGIFSFGDSAKQSYDRMIELVSRAEDYLRSRQAWPLQAAPPAGARQTLDRNALADFRARLSSLAGFSCLVKTCSDDRALDFARDEQVRAMHRQGYLGPATPDHIIRTKRVPMFDDDLAAYAQAYQAYFEEHRSRADKAVSMLDAAPRVILHSTWGLQCVGKTASDCGVIEDIYRHTMDIISSAQLLGGYRALAPSHLFDVEYWDLEQAKLRRAGVVAPFQGEVVLVTGAASGIGKACAQHFLDMGAAVVALDVDARVGDLQHRAYLGLTCDVTQSGQLETALDEAVLRFGGIDMAILNAGMFPGDMRISEMDLEGWRRVMAVNLDANLYLLKVLHPLLKRSYRYGRVVVIGSKNVPAPGPGAAAYSASKAALNQLARVAALEWGQDGIRVNSLHPNAVFDTGIWREEVLQARARHYGISVEQYKRNNVLKSEIRSTDVAALAAVLCLAPFAQTTGAQIPVDGGNERVI